MAYDGAPMERNCIKGQRIAFARLAVVVAMVALLSMLACRPAWSPDGKQLLFSGVDSGSEAGRRFVAVYDRETGKAERLLATPPGDSYVNALWTPDGKRAVVVSGSNGDGLTLSVTSVPPVGDPLVHKVRTNLEVLDSFVVLGAVVFGDHLFVADQGILRVDLKTGETKRIQVKMPGARSVVVPRGDGLCCIEVETPGRQAQKLSWEMTVLDPVTLERSPLLRSKDLADVECTPLPAFSGDLERIAMPSAEKHEVLVFREGKLEVTLPLGAKDTVKANDIAMSKDGATLYVTVCRSIGNGRFAWSLVEGTIGGAVIRERRLFATDKLEGGDVPGAMPSGALGLMLSPDARIAALSTFMTPETRPQDEGLYLVDLVGRQRTVTRIPFPAARPVSIRGSDLLLELAKQWATDFGKAHEQSVTVNGGGSGAGLAAVVAGECDLAMTARKLRQAELDAAKKRNVELQEHEVVRNAFTLCVNKKNPIASLTMEQLAKVFGRDGVNKWSELGDDLPKALGDLVVGICHKTVATPHRMRSSLLGQGPFAEHVSKRTSDEDLLALAAGNQDAIVCLSNPEAARNHPGVRIVPIRRDAKSPPIHPDAGAVRNGSYPLISSLFVYARKGGSANAGRFLIWLHGDEGWLSTRAAGF